jgi:SMI1 / KNR4 family (SUKH-1)
VLKEVFPHGIFGAPATEEQIAAVESTLRVHFPEQLRTLYRECDGFREDRGNAKYLLSLTENDSIGSLKTVTEFCWVGFKEVWPDLDLTPFIFFGSSAGDETWGIRWRGGQQIIAFHHNMEGVYEIVGSDIIQVYQADYAKYEPEP